MRIFETESIWDAEEQKWQEVYYINGEEVSMDEFNDEMDNEVNSDEEVDNYQEDVFDVEGCKDCEEYQECLKKYGDMDEDNEEEELEEDFECDCIDCTLDRYVRKIQEAGLCPHCIREVLADFLVCVVDHTS